MLNSVKIFVIIAVPIVAGSLTLAKIPMSFIVDLSVSCDSLKKTQILTPFYALPMTEFEIR